MSWPTGEGLDHRILDAPWVSANTRRVPGVTFFLTSAINAS